MLSFLYLGIALLVFSPRGLTAQSSLCLPDTVKESIDARHDFGIRVSLTDSISVAERNSFGLPALSESQVLIVTDAVACAAAANAFDTLFNLPYNSADRFIVLQAGNRRIVRLAGQVTHYTAHAVLDDTFTTVVSTFWH